MLERRSVRKYLDKEIPINELKEVLALAQRAPSSVNAQPYKVIVVRTPEDKMKLSKYMLLNNAKFVNSASATLIVCCDLDPLSHSHEITEMEKANGASEEEASMAERVLPSFFKKESFFSHLKEAVTGTYYKGEPMGVEGWAYKSAGFFMQQFVMLAQSKGWGTLYMGGFDSQSIKKAFHIPKTYDVCCTIAVGYPDETEKYHEHPRFPPNMVIYENEFGKPTKTEVPEVKQTYFWKSA
ncbi:hypothetical protein WA588_000188, partial [Blastocystis sp. NMH]